MRAAQRPPAAVTQPPRCAPSARLYGGSRNRPARPRGPRFPEPTPRRGARPPVPARRPRGPAPSPEARPSRRGRRGLPRRSRRARSAGLTPAPPLLSPRGPGPAAPHLTPSSRRHHPPPPPPPRPDTEARHGDLAGRSGSCSSAAGWRRAASRRADYKSQQPPRRGDGLRARLVGLGTASRWLGSPRGGAPSCWRGGRPAWRARCPTSRSATWPTPGAWRNCAPSCCATGLWPPRPTRSAGRARRGESGSCQGSRAARGPLTTAPSPQDSRTALHWACSAGHAAVADLLLGLGVPVGDKDDVSGAARGRASARGRSGPLSLSAPRSAA